MFEEGIALVNGLDHQTIDKPRGRLLLGASRDFGCRTALVTRRINNSNLSDEEKQKILKDLKEIATTSPYHWVDYFIAEWYYRGFGGEEKKKQAVVWWTKAINGGSAAVFRRRARIRLYSYSSCFIIIYSKNIKYTNRRCWCRSQTCTLCFLIYLNLITLTTTHTHQTTILSILHQQV